MDRSDRLLLEHQINDLDGMIRQMTNMRSVLVRRTQRMLNAPAASSGRIPSRARSSNVSRTDPSSNVAHPAPRVAALPSRTDPPSRTAPSSNVSRTDPSSGPVPNREFNIGGVNFNLNEMQNYAENPDVNGDVVRALLRLFDEEADNEIFVDYPAPGSAVHNQFVPPPPTGPVTVPVTVPVRVLKPKEKVVVIKKADLGKNMIDPCSICQEFYKKIDNVVSNCGHNCCKGCMTKWVEAQHVARKRATCPMCREQLTLLTGCRERAKPQRKPMAVNVIEDDVDSMVVEA